MSFGVESRDVERLRRYVYCDQPGAADVRGKRYGYAARPGPYIDDQRFVLMARLRIAGERDHPFDQKLGLRSGDQNGAADLEVKTIELLMARDVLQGLACCATPRRDSS